MPNKTPLDFEALVVDDEPDISELLSEYLRARGLTTATAQDGRAAIAALERSGGRYGLVLTDINMPGADGFEVLRAARAANASAFVVIITGFASLDSAIQAVRLGAHDYITKPFSLGQIDIMLSQIGDRVALERENRELASRAPASGMSSLDGRLEKIEHRLARIETLLTSDRRP
jgi:two-component system NtrC family response regulator